MTNDMKEIQCLTTRWFKQNAVVTPRPSDVTDEVLSERAYTAYCRAMSKYALPDQPARDLTEVQIIKGRRFVVVQNGYRELARYRVQNDGGLRRIRPD